MYKLLISFYIFCTMVLAATPVFADPVKLLTIALQPYGYMKHARIAGITHEIGCAIVKEAGYEVKEKLAPISRGIQDLSSGESEMMILIPNPSMLASANDFGSVLEIVVVALGRAGESCRSLAEIRGKTLAVVNLAQYDTRISKENGMIVYPTENYSQSLKMLLARRVDFAVGPKRGLLFTARAMGFPKHVFCEPLVLSTTHANLFISKKVSPEKQRRLGEARQRLLENGTFQAIIENYNL